MKNKNWCYLEQHIDEFPEYKESIFEQGFFLSNKDYEFGRGFPYYGNWRRVYIAEGINCYVHKNQKIYVYKNNNITYFLLGHAYDPFGYEANENIMLEKLDALSSGVFSRAIDYIYDWTGLFVLGIVNEDKITICGDFESMRTAYYGTYENNWYIVSHEELLALRENINRSQYVEFLEKYKWYYLYGEGLPGDISHYEQLKKLMCNTYVEYKNGSFSLKRLYPLHELKMCKDEEDYSETVNKIAQIMRSSMELTAMKWNCAAVSCTGGRDSKGTLAASSCLGDRLQFFSYNSQLAEKIDCDAAAELCKAAGVKHTIYEIPLDKGLYPEYDIVKAILCVNSNRVKFNHNDIMKRIYFRKNKPFEIEIKSWTSEIGRGYYYKRYGVKRMQKKCSARKVNVMNNIYLFSPLLMYKTDSIYREYLERSQYNEHMYNYDWSDIIELEMRDSKWGADVISCEHMFAYDVSIPYNNRHLGDLLLSPKLEDRISDRTHKDFTKKLCPPIEEREITVRDYAHDNKRLWMDKMYYFISCIRPF